MRRTLTVCRNGLSVAAAIAVLTACGGSGSDNSASSSSRTTTSSSASETSAEASGSEFCTEAASIEKQIGATLANQSDPTAIPQALQQAATAIRAITPPDEIASDWTALAGGVEQIAAAFGSVNFSDPQALATFQAQVGQLEAQLSTASTNVQTYLAEKCGLGTVPTESASPTS